jgi:hypothetical protein
MEMIASMWYDNPDVVKRVKTLLTQMGIPLEHRVAATCREFAQSSTVQASGASLTSRKVVYAPRSDPTVYREVDQVVHISQAVALSQNTGIHLYVVVPIECKYRKDVEYFALNSEDANAYKRFPISSQTYGSQLFELCVAALKVLDLLPPVEISGVEIVEGITPGKPQSENLVYNAASTLPQKF